MIKRWITKIIVTILKWFGTQHAVFTLQSRRFSPKQILVHLPSSLDSGRFSFIMESLRDTFPSGRFDFLTGEEFPDQFAKSILSAENPLHRSKIRNILKKDIRWYRLLKPELIEEIQDANYDLALDFELQFNLTMAHALGHSGAPVTIGYYQPGCEDVFHNLLLKALHPLNYDRLLFSVLELLVSRDRRKEIP